MNLLFIGDSITNGKLGVSFVNKIKHSHPQYKIKNLGVNGETLNFIIERLLNHLRAHNDYDYIILQGGYNDLLLPSFKNKSTLFNFSYNHQIKKGLLPYEDSNRTSLFLKEAIHKIKEAFKGKILLLTLGCVGENLNSNLNSQRNEFNQSIKQIVSEENLFLADVGIEFNKFLQDKKPSDYCIDKFWSVTLFDRIERDTNKLSFKRNLFLTIDGVHLNNAGAEMYADCIMKELKKSKK